MSYISSRKIHQMVNINAAQAAAAEDPDRIQEYVFQV
jgi:hypothetical protein